MTRTPARLRTTSGWLRPLRDALAYENDHVVARFRARFRISRREAEDLFRETRRWLWLCARTLQLGRRPVPIRPSMAFLDEMWHEFVLFAHDYETFCRRYLGRLIYHQPTTEADKRAARAGFRTDVVAGRKRLEHTLLDEYELIHDQLGEAVLRKWTTYYRRRYTPAFMNERRLPFR